MKYKIEVATSIRDFLNNLFGHEFANIEFINRQHSSEITGLNKVLLRKIFESKLLDLIGFIQVHKKTTSNDALITYNRFLSTDKPYYIICENPTALFHYRLGRNKGLLARRQIPAHLCDENLKGIVCISQACSTTFSRIHGVDCGKVYQIYPMIPDVNAAKGANTQDKITCLFVSSTFELKSGCEIVEVASKLPNVNFVLITRHSNIPEETKRKISSLKNIKLVEFSLSKEELAEYYLKSDILLHPTRQDSFALVVLEAMKFGLPVISTNVYAIPEMVQDGVNGYLTEPRYHFFDHYNMPNPAIWNHRKDTIYSKYIDENIIKFLLDKILLLDSNRELLKTMSDNSIKIAQDKFGEHRIKEQWQNLITETLG